MDKKKIMEDGLLEQYLTGELSDELQVQVEAALQKHKDLRAQFDALEADFERLGMEQAIAPPSQVKDSLKKTLEGKGTKKIQWFPFSVAASLALLFGVSAFWLYGKWQQAEDNLNSLQLQTADMQQRLDNLESDFRLTSNRLGSINNADVIPLVLYGNHRAPNARAVAYVNHKNKLVLVNPQGLPELPEDQTYQMWSDVEGEMINMGLVPTDEQLIPLKYIDHAESLNITIEPAGGNDHPTVEKLVSYVTL